MSTLTICLIICLHFIFDWMLQPRDIAKRKGKTKDGISAVIDHLSINILPFSGVLAFVLFPYINDIGTIFKLVTINIILHGIIDIVLPKGKNERQMINWTAIDQILHLTILFGLIEYFS